MVTLAALNGPNPQELQNLFMGTGVLAAGFIVWSAAIVSLLGILFMTMVVAPNVTQRLSGALRERNIMSFFAGIPVAGLFLVTSAIFHRSKGLEVANLLAFGVVLILGFASAAEDIGRRLYWACGKEGSRAAHLASGWLVFAFGACFPVLGWFGILPYVSLSGVGSVIVGTIQARRSAAPKDIEYPEK